MRVSEVTATATYPLRREVLRDGRPDADVTFDFDADAESLHLAAYDDDEIVGVASLAPRPTPKRPGKVAWQLRGMAVSPARQGSGVGKELVAAAVDRLAARGVEVIWADGRDTALGFYTRLGWVVEGDGYVTGIGLPHHTVLLDLA